MTIASVEISANVPNSTSKFTQTLKSLLELLDLEDDDEYGTLRPTESAFKTTINLIVEAYEHLGEHFPQGRASTDDEGGIRINWKNRAQDLRVCLFCPSNLSEKAYIYHQKNDEYASDEQVDGVTLVRWLDWFNQP
ncbi:hypothetical protein [Merismopedia glauca]|uniref:Uncharacterized protein n=1 Tax=Merismopedia glauca CCAP 1448/3 TaxID=1296344 RepID=A0A2T1BZJ5_9CYAN|nr:hypothetical protein [Merismopedia glauca]PSB01374.1 hypothetical protein C7B64_18735 [Merismopedia glauca CCAP 1448/3]